MTDGKVEREMRKKNWWNKTQRFGEMECVKVRQGERETRGKQSG